MRHFKNYAKILSQVRYDKKNASALGKNEESAQTTKSKIAILWQNTEQMTSRLNTHILFNV